MTGALGLEEGPAPRRPSSPAPPGPRASLVP